MKSRIISILVLVCLAWGVIPTASALDKGRQRVRQERQVEAFHAIDFTTVAEIYFTQSDQYSFVIEGYEEEVVRNRVSVTRDGVLTIDSTVKGSNGRNSVIIRVSAPTLTDINFCGVGSLNIDKPLRVDNLNLSLQGVGKFNIADLSCDKLKVEVEGVGKANLHVHCRQLTASVGGVGSITVSGEADYADIRRSGIGNVNTGRLTIRHAK